MEEFHWIITVQMQGGNTSTYDGQITLDTGVLKSQDLYKSVRNHMAQQVETDNFVVLFYSATPNNF